jgi:hypothetical protein
MRAEQVCDVLREWGSAVAVIEMVKVMMMIVITDLFFPSFDFHHEMINAMKLKEATQVTHTGCKKQQD